MRFQWHTVTVVTGYSGASAADLHGLPKINLKAGRYLFNGRDCISYLKKVKQQVNIKISNRPPGEKISVKFPLRDAHFVREVHAAKNPKISRIDNGPEFIRFFRFST